MDACYSELILEKKCIYTVSIYMFGVTFYIFFRKKRKLREKAEAEAKSNEDKKKKMKSGVHAGMSGRDMFLFDENMGSNEVYMIVVLLFLYFYVN